MMKPHTGDSNNAFILGLDGVPWEFMERWAIEGKLPNFAKVIEEGAAGPLQSTMPDSTPLAWPSIVTGTWPDQHGIYSFQNLTKDYTNKMNTNSRIQQTKLWDVLSPSIVGNIPMTYPVDEIDGKMVAGMLSPELNEQHTYPPELHYEIERNIPDYEIGLTWSDYVDQESELVDDITSLLEARRELMQLLMKTEDWRLFFFTYTEPDRLQHLVWDEEILLEHYQQLDDILGEIIKYVESHGASLYIVSDHGFGPISKKVSANTLLEDAGYLNRKEEKGGRSALSSVGVNKDNIKNIFDRIGINENKFIRKYIPDSVANRLAATVPGDHFLYDVDHSETEAFVHEMGNVYVNDRERFTEGPVNPEDVGRKKEELTSLFTSVTDPATGEQVLDVHDGDKLYSRDSRSPDLVLEPKKGYGVSRSLTKDQFTIPDEEAAHERQGIFLAWGPNIEAGTRTTNATVVDVAPTVLHTVGNSIPEEMDGRVLQDIFVPDSPPAERPVEMEEHSENRDNEDTDEDFDQVKSRLQGLGYME